MTKQCDDKQVQQVGVASQCALLPHLHLFKSLLYLNEYYSKTKLIHLKIYLEAVYGLL